MSKDEANKNKRKFLDDIREHLKEIHRMGFVYGDIRVPNIIRTQNGRYLLIDYGRTFSKNVHTIFPPMQYIIDYDAIPTHEDDIDMLDEL